MKELLKCLVDEREDAFIILSFHPRNSEAWKMKNQYIAGLTFAILRIELHKGFTHVD